MERDKFKIAKAINSVLMAAYEDGEISTNENGDLLPETLYSFDLEHIKGFSTHYAKAGDGVYFHLHDGRVFNSYGEEIENAKLEDFITVLN